VSAADPNIVSHFIKIIFTGEAPYDVYNLALAIVVLLVILISGLLNFFQEFSTCRSKLTLQCFLNSTFYKLQKDIEYICRILKGFANFVPLHCTVLRNGKLEEIGSKELVIGDIVYMQTGNKQLNNKKRFI
jgi:magnesium-transporting ATPase (P-type)